MEKMINSLKKINETYDNISSVSIEEFNPDTTAILIVDVINGFVKDGNLSSNRMEKIIQPIENLLKKSLNYKKVFIRDKHTLESIELKDYPIHCLNTSKEYEVIEELKKYIDENSKVIDKNSTNAFVNEEFYKWICENEHITNFILVGDCTDICIMQLGLTLKAYYNEKNIPNRIVVPKTCVETYDLDLTNHNGQLLNTMAFYMMSLNGIEVVDEII